jgi:phage shock protein A
MAATDESKMGTFDRMKNRVHGEEAMSHALAEMAGDNMEDRLNALGKDDEVERMLADIKNRKGVA